MGIDTNLTPGTPLTMSEDERAKLGNYLVELGNDLERSHSDLLSNIDALWDLYEAKPLQKRRTDPWDGASNIVVPLIRLHSDAIKARWQNIIFAAPDLWTFRCRNEDLTETARGTTDFINWASDDNEFDVYTPHVSAFDEAVPIGEGVTMLGWSSRKRFIFTPADGGKPTAQSVEMGRGPYLKHIPREQILWQVGRPVQDAEYVMVQSWKTWGDLITLEQTKGIDEGYLEKVKGSTGSSAYSAGIYHNKLKSGGISNDGSEPMYDIRQWWVEWPVLKGIKFEDIRDKDRKTPLIPLCVTLDHTTGTVLRVAAKPYYTSSWPFYQHTYRSTARGPRSFGVAAMLEHLQRAATIMLNQSIDAVTLSNALKIVTSDRRFMSQRFVPGRPLFADNVTETALRELNLSKQITPDIALINLCFSLAERLTGINDPSLGREIRYGGHPSPATSTALMLQESKELQRAMIKGSRLQFGRLGEDVATLYQQFETRGTNKIERALGMDDANKVKEWLFPTGPIAGNIEFDLRAVTENLNPEAEREQAIFTMQATSAFYGQVMQALQVAAHPNSPPPVKAAAIRSVEALAAGFEKVLAAAQVDDIKKFVFQLRESNGDPRVIQQVAAAVSNELGGLAASNGGRPLPPVATGPTGLPLATNGNASGSGF
jgi:hypothetical protein